ncbi:MAG: class I SAM-dependent methyltransferase [Pedobacter sp.]|nr:class I SAM-dependent methyltransferase [Pedobacter sp.]MDQ8053838.1 class I SAM-dependent methyltransferase [Pedobacter sp.]
MQKGTSNFYNKFSVCYPLVDFFLLPQKRILAAAVNEMPIGNLLEVGVGNGSHLKYYRQHQVTGIDISSSMLATARKSNPPQVRLEEMDGENLTYAAEQFDYIVLSHVIAVAKHPDKLLQEAHRVLKPQGKLLILNHFTPDHWMKYIDHAAQAIASLFHFRSIFRQEDIPTGDFSLIKEIKVGKLGYFKLLIFQKI